MSRKVIHPKKRHNRMAWGLQNNKMMLDFSMLYSLSSLAATFNGSNAPAVDQLFSLASQESESAVAQTPYQGHLEANVSAASLNIELDASSSSKVPNNNQIDVSTHNSKLFNNRKRNLDENTREVSKRSCFDAEAVKILSEDRSQVSKMKAQLVSDSKLNTELNEIESPSIQPRKSVLKDKEGRKPSSKTKATEFFTELQNQFGNKNYQISKSFVNSLQRFLKAEISEMALASILRYLFSDCGDLLRKFDDFTQLNVCKYEDKMSDQSSNSGSDNDSPRRPSRINSDDSEIDNVNSDDNETHKDNVESFLMKVKSCLKPQVYQRFLDVMVEIRSNFRTNKFHFCFEKIGIIKTLFPENREDLSKQFDLFFPCNDLLTKLNGSSSLSNVSSNVNKENAYVHAGVNNSQNMPAGVDPSKYKANISRNLPTHGNNTDFSNANNTMKDGELVSAPSSTFTHGGKSSTGFSLPSLEQHKLRTAGSMNALSTNSINMLNSNNKVSHGVHSPAASLLNTPRGGMNANLPFEYPLPMTTSSLNNYLNSTSQFGGFPTQSNPMMYGNSYLRDGFPMNTLYGYENGLNHMKYLAPNFHSHQSLQSHQQNQTSHQGHLLPPHPASAGYLQSSQLAAARNLELREHYNFRNLSMSHQQMADRSYPNSDSRSQSLSMMNGSSGSNLGSGIVSSGMGPNIPAMNPILESEIYGRHTNTVSQDTVNDAWNDLLIPGLGNGLVQHIDKNNHANDVQQQSDFSRGVNNSMNNKVRDQSTGNNFQSGNVANSTYWKGGGGTGNSNGSN